MQIDRPDVLALAALLGPALMLAGVLGYPLMFIGAAVWVWFWWRALG